MERYEELRAALKNNSIIGEIDRVIHCTISSLAYTNDQIDPNDQYPFTKNRQLGIIRNPLIDEKDIEMEEIFNSIQSNPLISGFSRIKQYEKKGWYCKNKNMLLIRSDLCKFTITKSLGFSNQEMATFNEKHKSIYPVYFDGSILTTLFEEKDQPATESGEDLPLDFLIDHINSCTNHRVMMCRPSPINAGGINIIFLKQPYPRDSFSAFEDHGTINIVVSAHLSLDDVMTRYFYNPLTNYHLHLMYALYIQEYYMGRIEKELTNRLEDASEYAIQLTNTKWWHLLRIGKITKDGRSELCATRLLVVILERCHVEHEMYRDLLLHHVPKDNLLSTMEDRIKMFSQSNVRVRETDLWSIERFENDFKTLSERYSTSIISMLGVITGAILTGMITLIISTI